MFIIRAVAYHTTAVVYHTTAGVYHTTAGVYHNTVKLCHSRAACLTTHAILQAADGQRVSIQSHILCF